MKKYLYLLLLVSSLTMASSFCLYPDAAPQEIAFKKGKIHYLGIIPGANSQIEYQLDLFDDNTYYLRTKHIKNETQTPNHDDIGRWHIEDGSRLVLWGGRDAPLYFSLIDEESIELLNLKGESIDSELNYELEASDTAKMLEPELYLTGMYSYMADAAQLEECITKKKYPVAFEEDHITLEKAYLQSKIEAAEKLKIHLKAKIVMRKAMDSQEKIPTIVVKRFIKLIPKEVCQPLGSVARLKNTYWKLTMLGNTAIKKSTARKEAHMIVTKRKIKGNTSCNSFGGKYILEENKISLANKNLMMTRMFCQGSVEAEFTQALKDMYRYQITGEYLEIFDKNNKQLARFESVYLY